MDHKRCDYELLKAIARKLKGLRQKKGLSQRLVYIDTYISIGKIEEGKTDISVSALSVSCKYYGISPGEFFQSSDAEAE